LSRFAANSKLDEVRVDDSYKTFTTVRPRSVGSFFTSRSSEREKLFAVASSRSTSSRSRSPIEIRCRRGGCFGGRKPSRMPWISPMAFFGHEQASLDLVDLDELDLDAFVAGGGQVLADVIRADGELAVAAVGEYGQLHAL